MTKIYSWLKKLTFLIILNNSLMIELFNKPNNKPIIAFDVDDVLVIRSVWEQKHDYISIIKESHHQLSILGIIPWLLYSYLTGSFKSILKQYDADTAIDWIAQQYPILKDSTSNGQSALERIKETASKARPIVALQDILLSLYQQGYPIAIATNQGRKTFDRLMHNGTVPSAEHYILIFTSDAPENPTKNGILIKKPNPQYFQNLKTALKNQPIIFIDDNKTNVEAARKLGITSIQFDHKNIGKFIDDLQKLGITVDAVKQNSYKTSSAVN